MMRRFLRIENEPLSAILHFAGFLLSIAALVVLVVFAAQKGTAWHVVGFAIFGSSLILLYAASTLYHSFPAGRAKDVFRRLDHSLIYVLIAGSYTPVCLVALRGAWGWTFLGIIWAIAATGISLKSCGVKMNPIASTLVYLVMGWLAVIAFLPLRKSLSSTGFFFLIAGGIAYSLGAVAFTFDRHKINKWLGLHEVFHLFVLIGSTLHFFLMLTLI